MSVDDEAALQSTLEELRICQLELAQVRSAQEPLLEELSLTKAQLERTRKRLARLSKELNDHLARVPPPSSNPGLRAYRWAKRRRLASKEEWEQVDLLRRSPLFNGPWYVRHYPEVARAGLPPALHYLRFGAATGLDPGPDFDTRRYLRQHPDLDPALTNPLVHLLRTRTEGGHGA